MDKELVLSVLNDSVDIITKNKNSIIVYCGKKAKDNVIKFLHKEIKKEIPCYIWNAKEVDAGVSNNSFYKAFIKFFGYDNEFTDKETEFLKCIISAKNAAKNNNSDSLCIIFDNIKDLSQATIEMLARIKYELMLKHNVRMCSVLIGDKKEYGEFSKTIELDYDRISRAFMAYSVNLEGENIGITKVIKKS